MAFVFRWEAHVNKLFVDIGSRFDLDAVTGVLCLFCNQTNYCIVSELGAWPSHTSLDEYPVGHIVHLCSRGTWKL